MIQKLFCSVCLILYSFSCHAIVLGERVEQTELETNFSYLASIRASFEAEDHRCGGVVLSERWVLTAAHCLVESETSLEGEPSNPESFTIYEVTKPKELAITVGVANLSEVQLSNVYNVTHVVIHPDYHPENIVKVNSTTQESLTTAYQNDLALLYTERDIESSHVTLVDDVTYEQLLSLEEQWDPVNPNPNVQVIGWGTGGDSNPEEPALGLSSSDTELKETLIAFISTELCFDRLESAELSPRYIASKEDMSKICTLPTKITTDPTPSDEIKDETDNFWGNGACLGDTGGPLLMDGVLVGIIGSSPIIDRVCSSVTLPTWYANVYFYLEWLSSYTSSETPPENAVTLPSFMESMIPPSVDDTPDSPDVPIDIPLETCDTPSTVTVGSATEVVGCVDSDSSGGGFGLFGLVMLAGLLIRRRVVYSGS